MPERSPAPAAAATDNGPGAARAIDDNARPAVVELAPEIMYLRDKSGKLVPVPGFSYEDFLELMRLKHNQDQRAVQAPQYSLQQLILQGAADGRLARLTAQIDLLLAGPDWVQVPLGLGSVALEGPVKYEGDGECLLDYDETGRQYRAWVRGGAGRTHRLSLRFQTPLTVTGEQRKLALFLPRAATSELSLRVPAADVVASATPSQLVPEVTTENGASNIHLLGVNGNLVLSWSKRGRDSTATGPVLESNANVLVRIDGRSVTSDATLQVRSFGTAFERFRVRLPKDAVLAGAPKSGYTVTAVDGADGLVEVVLDKPTLGPIEVNLVTEHAFDVTRSEALELAGFEIVEGVSHRQGGQLGIVVTGDWQVVWESRARVRQIDEPSAETLQRPDLFAAFEYVGQPFSLTARVLPRQPRIAVDPQYVYYVDAFQSRLEGRLKYSIRGAKVFSVELDLPGWQIDEIGPASIVDLKSMVIGEDARLKIPLLDPTVGEVELTIKAHRSHSVNPGDVELALPVVKDAIVGPATIAIVPEDNVELTTRTDQLVALSKQRAPANLSLPPRRQEPLIFRAERGNAKYVGGLTVHKQKLTVKVANTAAIHRNGVDVEQRFQYQVLYEPIERFDFRLPTEMASPGDIEMFVNDQRLEPAFTADDASSEHRLRMQLELPEPRIGLAEVIARYHLALDDLRPATNVPLNLPLLMPLQGEFAGNTLEVSCEAGLAAELRSGNWKLAGPGDAGDARLRLTAATAASLAPLSVVVQDRPAAGGAAVQRAWIQTWVADQSRQERAVFRIDSPERHISLMLPSDVDANELEALVDRQPVRPTLRNGNTIAISLPAGTTAHTLELRYPYTNAPKGTAIALNVPDFGEGVPLRRLYWQLVVPRNQHLLIASSNLTPEFRWIWEGLHWSRRNLLTQAELEEWTGTLAEPEAPDLMNVYLFSAIGNGQSSTARIARRSTIVFAASALALATVLLALYIPAMRRPRWIVAIGAGIGILGLAYPEPAAVLAQAALLGVGLAVVAALLHRMMPHEAHAPALPAPPADAVVERSSTDVFRRPGAASPSSTASVALALEHPRSESQVR